MKRPLLVIGCGSIGRRHIRNLMSLGTRNIIAFDPREDRRNAVARELGIEAIPSLEGAWKREPAAALIAAPPNLHVPLAVEAARHDCDVFIEKPLSHSLDGVDELSALVNTRRLTTLVGCNLRFHPGLVRVKQMVDRGAIGNIVAVRAQVGQYLPDWHPQEDYRTGYSARRELGGGVILDAIHEIDYVRWLFGEVQSVACVAGKLSRLEIDTEDTAGILLRMETGVIAEIHLDYVQRIYTRNCEVIGDGGTVRWDYAAGDLRVYSAGKWEVFEDPPGWLPNQMYVDEMSHFLGCLQGTEQPVLDLSGALRVLEIAIAAKNASARATPMVATA